MMQEHVCSCCGVGLSEAGICDACKVILSLQGQKGETE